jgi:hypothetical protein
MIRVLGLSGEIARYDLGEMRLWDIATKVKREKGISRGDQVYFNGTTKLSKSTRLGQMDITMVCMPVACGGCGRPRGKRKYRICGKCRDEYYCDEACQRGRFSFCCSSSFVLCCSFISLFLCFQRSLEVPQAGVSGWRKEAES